MTDYKLPFSIKSLTSYRQERFFELLQLLHKNPFVTGIALGGSLSYKTDIENSDIDLFCLINESASFKNKLPEILSSLTEIDTIIFQGNFAWTEALFTVYYKSDVDFSIDLCLIDAVNLNTFFWEPEAYILYDENNSIGKSRLAQMSRTNYTRQPFLKANPFCLSIVTVKKIRKNLSRLHLWNALEMLSIFRRYVMQIIRLDAIGDTQFLGRVDRDIEDVIPQSINIMLAESTAKYDEKDIAKKAIILVDIFEGLIDQLDAGEEILFKRWILTQLAHEKKNLIAFIDA